MDLNLKLNSLDITQDVSETPPPNTDLSNENLVTNGKPRRSLRPRKVAEGVVNRRAVHNPKKLTTSSSVTDVKDYYMCKKVKRLPSTLETIFEEPRRTETDIQYMSLKKFRRVLDFPNEEDCPQKLTKRRKRLLKAKKMTSRQRVNNKKKVALEMLLSKLADLDAENESQNKI